MEDKKVDATSFLEELKNKLHGIGVREFGAFAARFDDELNIIVESSSGWMVKYPFGNETWAILSNWLDRWDEAAQKSVERFVKVVVFPSSVRLSDIDGEYLEDILMAHSNLNDRNLESGKQAANDDADDAAGDMAEEISEEFAEKMIESNE